MQSLPFRKFQQTEINKLGNEFKNNQDVIQKSLLKTGNKVIVTFFKGFGI